MYRPSPTSWAVFTSACVPLYWKRTFLSLVTWMTPPPGKSLLLPSVSRMVPFGNTQPSRLPCGYSQEIVPSASRMYVAPPVARNECEIPSARAAGERAARHKATAARRQRIGGLRLAEDRHSMRRGIDRADMMGHTHRKRKLDTWWGASASWSSRACSPPPPGGRAASRCSATLWRSGRRPSMNWWSSTAGRRPRPTSSASRPCGTRRRRPTCASTRWTCPATWSRTSKNCGSARASRRRCPIASCATRRPLPRPRTCGPAR